METLLIIANVLCPLIFIILSLILLRYRTRFYQAISKESLFPVPTKKLSDLHDIFTPNSLGPSLNTEVSLIGLGDHVPGGISDHETWILSVLAKVSKNIFEFGTATGKTSYLMAKNSRIDAKIFTLTLASCEQDLNHYQHVKGDNNKAAKKAKQETLYSYYYSGTPEKHKINQLYGDSKAFNHKLYHEVFDLIFIDGAHTYSYIKHDTEKAMDMLRPGGIIIWHDYKGPLGAAKDVYKYLNHLSKTLPIFRIGKTHFAVYKKYP